MREKLQDEVDKCRRRDMILKTDLGDIHTREIADLKLHYRSKYRTKMLNFE
jgi:hypothetical protein